MKQTKKTRIVKGRVTQQQGDKLDKILKRTVKTESEWIRERIDRARE